MSDDVSLNDLANDIPLREPRLADRVADEVIKLFGQSFKATTILTVILVLLDACFLAGHVIGPNDRLITENVVLAIIGASTVQVGSAMIAIVYSIFRRSSETETSA